MPVDAELNIDQIDGTNQSAITNKLLGLDGVMDVHVDLGAKIVTVSYEEGRTRLVDIKQTIMEDGFSVMEV